LTVAWAINEEIENPTVAPTHVSDKNMVVANSESAENKQSSSGPNYQKTIQALNNEKLNISNEMAKATSEAYYWEVKVAKEKAENEIEDLELAQSVSHTQTAIALGAQETLAVATVQHGKQLMANELAASSDRLQSEKEKNDIDVANHEYVQKIKHYSIISIIVGCSVIFLLFIAITLYRAQKNQKWTMNQAQVLKRERTKLEVAESVSAIINQEETERELVKMLVDAIATSTHKDVRLDNHFVPRFDKIQDGISQPDRDKAVEILVKYGYCLPVQQGKATQLTKGTFVELREEIKYRDFPPTSLVNQRLRKTYLQQSTVPNSSQQLSTVREIGNGVLVGK